MLGSAIQNTKCAGYGQPKAASLFHAFRVIHEDEIGFQMKCQENRVMFAGVQIR